MASGGSHEREWRPDWRSGSDYAPLLNADRRAFAWEWLRRTDAYWQDWQTRDQPLSDSAKYGLVAFENPSLPAPFARPIWAGAIDPQVIDSHATNGSAEPLDRLDIRDFADYVSVEVDGEDEEHWLLSDGQWAIRIDVHSGTLLGGPVLLDYRLGGLISARPGLDALAKLVTFGLRRELPRAMLPQERHAHRWILELRTADALAEGQTQQEIARGLFGSMIEKRQWRIANASHRLRVQRLVREARKRLERPLDPYWFR